MYSSGSKQSIVDLLACVARLAMTSDEHLKELIEGVGGGGGDGGDTGENTVCAASAAVDLLAAPDADVQLAALSAVRALVVRAASPPALPALFVSEATLESAVRLLSSTAGAVALRATDLLLDMASVDNAFLARCRAVLRREAAAVASALAASSKSSAPLRSSTSSNNSVK